MIVEKASLEGVLLIKPKVFRDSRGFFLETWQVRRYQELGIPSDFVQDNISFSTKGVLRGLHYQKKFPQGKLVEVITGRVFDVVVDIRPNSSSFGKWFGVILSEQNHQQLWIPPGMAHGFVVLSDAAHFHYKCTDYYHPEDEGSIRWSDPDLDVKWPLSFDPIVSEKDAKAPFLFEVKEALLRKEEC